MEVWQYDRGDLLVGSARNLQSFIAILNPFNVGNIFSRVFPILTATDVFSAPVDARSCLFFRDVYQYQIF